MLDPSQRETPASWDRRKIKFHLSGFFGGGTPSKDNLDYWTDGTVPWVTPKDMKRRMIDTAEDLITVNAVKNSATNMVPPSSVLMVVRSGILKHSLPVALNTVPVALNQDMKAFRFRRSLLPAFFAYWIEGQQKQKLLEWCQIGATVDNINVDAMLNGQIAVPDLATQRQIADFLDRETARIDLLIEKKQRLVALLGEKTASKQQSEIDDLLKAVGQSRLKNFTVSITTGPFGSAIKQDEYIEGGVPILNPAHISDGKIVPDLSVTLSEAKFRDLYYWHLIKGDLLMGRRGELGRCAVVEEDFGDGICGTGCLRLRVPPKHNSLYLQIIISSRRAREWLDLYAVGTTMKNLNEAIVGGLPVPNARREQQDEFVSEIQNARQKNAEVCSSITSSINRLKEYRSALITAAVTGQIDVQTYVKSGTTDRRLDAIQEELGA